MRQEISLSVIEETTEKRYWNSEKRECDETAALETPCGQKFPVQFWDKPKLINEHVRTCKACLRILGITKATKGYSQNDVALLWSKGIFGLFSANDGNVRSTENTLMHYNTIEAEKSAKGEILSNLECWSGGFARCPNVPNVKYSLDITTIRNILGIWRDGGRIEVLDHNDDMQNATLVKHEECYLVGASDERHRFVSILYDMPRPRTVKEAFDSMKPELVKRAEAIGANVKRQGEFFFIPLDDVREIYSERLLSETEYGLEQKAKEFVKEYDYQKGESIETKRFRWNYPQIMTETHHTATEKKTVKIELSMSEHGANGFIELTAVRGIIRHNNGDHRALNLGQKWHVAIKNHVVRSETVGRRSRGAD